MGTFATVPIPIAQASVKQSTAIEVLYTASNRCYDAMTARFCWCFVVLCGLQFHVVTSYVQPADSSVDLNIWSNGTVSFQITFKDWTGYWSSSTVLAAGAWRE